MIFALGVDSLQKNNMQSSILLVVLYCMVFVTNANIEDSPWLLQSSEFPSDPRLVPAVGNGHVATQVLSDTIYLNNVYNGYGNNSHRARIPSTIAVQVLEEFEESLFTLDMRNGVFTIDQTSDSQYSVHQKVYAHRTRHCVLVNEISVIRTGADGALRLTLYNNRGNDSQDMELVSVPGALDSWLTYGNTIEPETNESLDQFVYMYWNDIPSELILAPEEVEQHWLFITSVCIAEVDAWNDYEDSMRVGREQLLLEHITAWESLWDNGHIEVHDNLSLAQTLNAAMFHILISVPDVQDRSNPFAGLSPGGLARGGIVEPELTSPYNDYKGHVFWDMDTWIMPALLLFHPHMAKFMIQSRTRVAEVAKDNAALSGRKGIRFPWEQAHTGYEVCPWDLAALYQIHVTADVSYSLRQYLYATRDVEFITERNEGKNLAMDIARFWESRTILLNIDKGYEILGVMGPDEYASNVNNSVFTNYNALLSLQLPGYLHTKLGISFNNSELEELQRFEEVANEMFLLFDEDLQYHPQYEGFQIENTTIKQSDVVLLGYPLMKNMTTEVRQNDLEIYEELTDKHGPDTGTWSMHTVGWLELGDWDRANDMFSYMLRNINGPFKIFSEKPADGEDGMRATNFITLAGGMLQAVLYGYGGLRLQPHQLDINPALLPGSSPWHVHSLTYRGARLSLGVQEEGTMTIELIDIVGAEPMVMYTWRQCNRVEMDIGVELVFEWDKVSFVMESEEDLADLCTVNW